jgi:hypothetical protein
VRTKEYVILINATIEAKGLENERNIQKNTKSKESTNDEQKSTLSPALEEEHEYP